MLRNVAPGLFHCSLYQKIEILITMKFFFGPSNSMFQLYKNVLLNFAV